MDRWTMLGCRALLAASIGLGCSPRAPEGDPIASHGDAEAEPATAPPTVTSAWPEHTSEICRFSVKLPGPRSRQPTPPGLLDQIAAEDPLQRVAMLASCGDVASVGSPREFLDITSGVIARQLHATIDQRTTIELQGRPGLELRMTIPAADTPPTIPWPGDLSYRLRLYVAGTRQYQLHVLHPAAAQLDDTPERFMSGFGLLDDAPAATAPPLWSTQTIEGITLEAPGTAVPVEVTSTGLLHGVRFEGEGGRATPYALRVWAAGLPGALDDPIAQLRAHVLARVATEHTEIIEQTVGKIAGRPMLDVVYRPNLPLPEHLAPQDAKTRAAVRELIERNPSEFRLRLVWLADDRIAALLAADPEPEDDAARFFDSLSISG